MSKKSITEQVDNYMSFITDFLTRKWGNVDQAWQVSLMQIRDCLYIYLNARCDVMKRGVCVKDRFDNLKVNESISVMNQSINRLETLLRNFGLNPLANARIHANEEKGVDNLALDSLMMTGDDDIDENEENNHE